MGWAAGSNPTVEKIVNDVAAESNAAKRATLYRNFQLELNKNSPLMPLLQSPSVLVAAKSVKGMLSNPIWKINLTELK
jgi:ABC-type transport system substrate-binding protein